MSKKRFAAVLGSATLCVYSALSFPASAAIGYDNDHPSNVVAVVAGYQNMRKHESGLEVPFFSIEDGAGAGQETGILFCIIAPTNYAGRFFFVRCPRGLGPYEDQHIPSENLFNKNKLYSFSFALREIQAVLESKSHFDPSIATTTTRLEDTEYFWSVADAAARLLDLHERLQKARHDLAGLKEEFKRERRQVSSGEAPKTDAFRKLGSEVSRMASVCDALEGRVEDTEKQLERLTKMPINSRQPPKGMKENGD